MLNRQEKTGEGGQAPHTERMKIYLAELGEKADSSVQGGTRPVIVLQNNAGNRSSPTVIVAPITSKLEKPHLPTHVVLGQSNLPKQSMVLLEQVMTIDQKLLIKEYGEISVCSNTPHLSSTPPVFFIWEVIRCSATNRIHRNLTSAGYSASRAFLLRKYHCPLRLSSPSAGSNPASLKVSC